MAYQQHRATEKYRDHRAKYCASFTSTPQQREACEEEKANAYDYLPWGYKLSEWPNGIEAWAIIATGIFICWQAVETRNAAIASQSASKAALTQLAHSVIAQRAWMTVSDVIAEEFIGGIDTITREVRSGVQFRFILKNEGSTPATECSAYCAKEIIDSRGGIPTFTIPSVTVVPKCVVYPHRTINGVDLQIFTNEIESLRVGSIRLFLFCRISYQTVYEPDIRRFTDICIEAIPNGNIQGTGAINWHYPHIGPQNTGT